MREEESFCSQAPSRTQHDMEENFAARKAARIAEGGAVYGTPAAKPAPTTSLLKQTQEIMHRKKERAESREVAGARAFEFRRSVETPQFDSFE